MMAYNLLSIIFLMSIVSSGWTYSAIKDYNIIKAYLEETNFIQPTPPKNHAKVARSLVHKSDWASIGTISTELEGFPMVNIISIADSEIGGKSTGNIYFLMTDLDFTGKDWRKHNKVTVTITSDQDGECKNKGVDTLEPTCPRIILSGSVNEIDQKSEEYNLGFASFVSRHPAAKNWVKEHNFYLCKLIIENIILLDWYGGAKHIPVDDYFNAVIL